MKLDSCRRLCALVFAKLMLLASLFSYGTAHATEPATGYIPILPPIIIILPILKPVMASCALRTDYGGGYLVSRDILINSYQGWSADSLAVRYHASVAGTYKFRITLRESNTNGDVITISPEQTVNLTAGGSTNHTTYFSNVYVGRATNLAISHDDVAGPGTLYMESTSAASCTNSAITGSSVDVGFVLRGESVHEANEVVEYNLPALNKYFITGRTDEKATLDAMPNVFTRTGHKFVVPSKKNYGNVSDVYRFFAPAPGPQSHAFVDRSDHDLIVSLPNTGLIDEGADFGTVKPDNSGTCPTWAPIKIYRSFHNTAAVGQRNHRYSSTLAVHNAMVAQGWLNEGVVFCGHSGS